MEEDKARIHFGFYDLVLGVRRGNAFIIAELIHRP